MSQIYYPSGDSCQPPLPPYHETKAKELLELYKERALVLAHAKEVIQLLEQDEETRTFCLALYKDIQKEVSAK